MGQSPPPSLKNSLRKVAQPYTTADTHNNTILLEFNVLKFAQIHNSRAIDTSVAMRRVRVAARPCLDLEATLGGSYNCL